MSSDLQHALSSTDTALASMTSQIASVVLRALTASRPLSYYSVAPQTNKIRASILRMFSSPEAILKKTIEANQQSRGGFFSLIGTAIKGLFLFTLVLLIALILLF